MADGTQVSTWTCLPPTWGLGGADLGSSPVHTFCPNASCWGIRAGFQEHRSVNSQHGACAMNPGSCLSPLSPPVPSAEDGACSGGCCKPFFTPLPWGLECPQSRGKSAGAVCGAWSQGQRRGSWWFPQYEAPLSPLLRKRVDKEIRPREDPPPSPGSGGHRSGA